MFSNRIEEIDNKINWVAITAIISLSVPLLYIIGRAYIDSYLKVYGINTLLFSYTTQDYLYFALFGIFQSVWIVFLTVLHKWWVILLAGIVGMALVMILRGDKHSLKLKVRSFIKKFSVSSISLRVISSGIVGVLILVVYLLTLILLIFILAVPLTVGQSAGSYVAKNEIKNDITGCAKPNLMDLTACTIVSKGDKVIGIGRIIAASDKHIALAKNGKVVMLVEDGLSYEVLK